MDLNEEMQKQLDEVQWKIQTAIYDGETQIEVEYSSLHVSTIEYLKKNGYKVGQ